MRSESETLHRRLTKPRFLLMVQWGDGRPEENRSLTATGLLSAILMFKVDGSFQKLGVPYFGALIVRILLFRVLC